jgi:hypothetical protein
MRVQVVSLVAVVVATMAFVACSDSGPTTSGPAQRTNCGRPGSIVDNKARGCP